MPDATVLINIATTPTQWEIQHGPILASDPPDGRAEFAALEVHAPAGSLRLAGPGATLDRDPAPDGSGRFAVGRRSWTAYASFEHGNGEPDVYEVTAEAAAGLLGVFALLKADGWRLEGGPADALDAWGEGRPITAAMLETPPPTPPVPADPARPGGEGT